ncbi:hypothetical protein P3S67_012934 [Capsicum chacoense]
MVFVMLGSLYPKGTSDIEGKESALQDDLSILVTSPNVPVCLYTRQNSKGFLEKTNAKDASGNAVFGDFGVYLQQEGHRDHDKERVSIDIDLAQRVDLSIDQCLDRIFNPRGAAVDGDAVHTNQNNTKRKRAVPGPSNLDEIFESPVPPNRRKGHDKDHQITGIYNPQNILS